jgi:drug/metabolite transporter (DMT)-like permease
MASAMAQHRKGVVLMIGATLCWATAGVLVRNMEVVDAWKITFWRSFFMTMFLLAVLSFQHGGGLAKRIHAMGWPGWALACGSRRCSTLHPGAVDDDGGQHAGIRQHFFMAAPPGRIFRTRRSPPTWIAMLAAIGGITVMFFDSCPVAAGPAT